MRHILVLAAFTIFFSVLELRNENDTVIQKQTLEQFKKEKMANSKYWRIIFDHSGR